MNFEARYKKLNIQQKKAVDTIEGPVMVIAGPGTGKTELLSMRIANILKKTDTLPENILCLTFTESGATAMRTRLASIIGMDAYKVAIHTFHSFGTEVINQNSTSFYNGAPFRPADELSCYELLHTIFDELEYSNPLSSKMNGEYTYLSDTITAISELKKSGLTSSELLRVLDANDAVYDIVEPYFQAAFEGRLSKTTVHQLGLLLPKLQQADAPMVLPTITSVAKILSDSLEVALDKTEADGSTTHVRAWRDAWFKKDADGHFVFKSRERQAKLRSASYVYGRYIERMQEEELFDFDDMILQVVHAMEVDSELRFTLQEQYQYIMVDEFQDTNQAQMRILLSLTNNEVNAGRPNILAVGDDDQAIYSFQGANVGNIHTFYTSFENTAQISLIDNYRSTEKILTHARDVITLGEERLENLLPNLDKTLTPHYEAKSPSIVQLTEHPSLSDERHWISQSIARLIEKGTPAHSIAVIARRHHELQSLIPYLTRQHIDVNYERRDNVLDNEVVKLTELVAQIAVALFERRHDDADAFLPELLAHPAFAISPQDIWRLSISAHDKHQKWMEAMEETPQFQPLQTWLILLSQSLAHQPLERMLDMIIGVPQGDHVVESPFDDNESEDEATTVTPFTSPIFGYYFSPKALEATPGTYLTYLEALRSIRAHLREYQPEETPALQSFLEFIRLHRELGSTITSIRPESSAASTAINLLTAHKSKGLEFDHVFIIGAIDSSWGEHVRSRSRLIGYPENLKLAPSGDTLDERLRLFFVAMTRARFHLEISYSLSDDNGKGTLRASFLHTPSWSAEAIPESDDQRIEAAELAWYQPLINPPDRDLRPLLASRLENYKLSATHVNNFLDVTHGGPQGFLLNNLLGFPQAMGAGAGFGSAIHASLQQAHVHLSATGDQRPLEDILHDFEGFLREARLDDLEFATYLQRGSDVLTAFINDRQPTFMPHQKAELSFAGQGVQINDMRLTGLLDLVDINTEESTIVVTDYKTGKPLRDWKGKTDYDKVKLHKYRQQLMFYNLLVRHSRDYRRFGFQKGILQFVEPTHQGDIIELEAQFTEEELERFTLLLAKVWEHIMALDFPDVSQYEANYKGILAFEEDLLK